MKDIGRLVKIFVITLFILITLLFLVWLIPERAVGGHVNEAIRLLKEHEELWEEHFTYAWGTKLDNQTDMVMIGRAVSNANEDSSLLFRAFYCNDYARYWHGYLIILRPLLAVMSYMQIRYLYMVIHIAALVGIALKIEKRFDKTIVYSWVASMIAVNFVSLPFSLQYSWVFFIMYGAIYYIDRNYGERRGLVRDNDFMCAFLVIGMLTSFMDLLTAPLLTLGIPMIYLLMLRIRLEHVTRVKCDIILTIKASFVWAVGYIGCWAMKWILASPVLKTDLLSEAILQIGKWTKGNPNRGEGIQSSLLKALVYNVYALLPPGLTNEIKVDEWMPFFIAVFICLGILVVLFIRYHESKNVVISYIPIGILMLYPYAWFGVTTKHAQVHPMFTYRNQIITVMGGWIIVSQCIRWSKVKERIRTRVMNLPWVAKEKRSNFDED